MARVSRWGNSLAVRLPISVVEKLALGEGDEVVLTANDDGGLDLSRDRTREDAVAALRNLRWKVPADYKFDREAISRRGGGD